MENKNFYIKTDENKIINEKAIIWIQKIEECLYICSKNDGCSKLNTHKICKINNYDEYTKLIKNFS